jgi:hypothetical protein
MDAPSPSSVAQDARSPCARLNEECSRITLDRDALCQALEREVGDPDFSASPTSERAHTIRTRLSRMRTSQPLLPQGIVTQARKPPSDRLESVSSPPFA